ncbi:Intraflagellar transport complex B, subunit 20 [Giardia muris]|uniref:Intraflagellar transport complex B, subunit 20 n=1 Tax=Giardia muris TaxID=5742 RepID=A0A4Z1SUZ6_GIAMU|nr:Intraflagellar transport complex B, subunit 20 [Giardia muris]|eukprot:TNJ29634.1 Intraflagellar transport complex B, subunit 20 [Giardia muris]
MEEELVVFDDDQRARILRAEQRERADEIVDTAAKYKQTLDAFNKSSESVLDIVQSVVTEVEARRRFALSLAIGQAGREAALSSATSMANIKASLANSKLEILRFENAAIDAFQQTSQQTRTAITEVFGGCSS